MIRVRCAKCGVVYAAGFDHRCGKADASRPVEKPKGALAKAKAAIGQKAKPEGKARRKSPSQKEPAPVRATREPVTDSVTDSDAHTEKADRSDADRARDYRARNRERYNAQERQRTRRRRAQAKSGG